MKLDREWKWLTLLVIIRILVLVLCVGADFFLSDHEADGVEIAQVTFSSQWSQALLSPFIKWDGAHYINISVNGYKRAQHLVFLPFLPYLLKAASTLRLPFFNPIEISIIFALLWNIFASAVCLIVLRRILLDKLKYNTERVTLACYCYVFNPATIFFTTLYTESSYCMFTFCALAYLGESTLFSCLCLLFASFTRSNGAWNAIIVGGYFAQEAYRLWLNNTCKDDSHKGGWVAFFWCALQGLCAVLCSICPAILWQVVSWMRLCNGAKPLEPDYCAMCSRNRLAVHSPYSFLQGKYWSVGFLSFYQPKQLPNFLLGLPICLYALRIVYIHCKHYFKGQSMSYILMQPSLPYVLHLVVLLVTLLGWAHMQISTRVLCSASPLVYLALAEELQSEYAIRKYFVLLFLVVYGIDGAIAHVNFYPWT